MRKWNRRNYRRILLLVFGSAIAINVALLVQSMVRPAHFEIAWSSRSNMRVESALGMFSISMRRTTDKARWMTGPLDGQVSSYWRRRNITPFSITDTENDFTGPNGATQFSSDRSIRVLYPVTIGFLSVPMIAAVIFGRWYSGRARRGFEPLPPPSLTERHA